MGSIEGMERERACRRWELVNVAWGMEVEHEMPGVCRMGVSVIRAMVVSHGSQCQDCLNFIRLHCHVHCKPMTLPLGIPLLSYMVTTTTNLPKHKLVQPVICAVSVVFSPVHCW